MRLEWLPFLEISASVNVLIRALFGEISKIEGGAIASNAQLIQIMMGSRFGHHGGEITVYFSKEVAEWGDSFGEKEILLPEVSSAMETAYFSMNPALRKTITSSEFRSKINAAGGVHLSAPGDRAGLDYEKRKTLADGTKGGYEARTHNTD